MMIRLDRKRAPEFGSFPNLMFSSRSWRRPSGRPPLSPLRSPALVDHVDRPPRRENCALLPGAELAQMFAGEIERAVWLVEQRVGALLARLPARGDAEAVRHLAPGDRHRLFELAAAAGMQTLDRRARQLKLLA